MPLVPRFGIYHMPSYLGSLHASGSSTVCRLPVKLAYFRVADESPARKHMASAACHLSKTF